MRTIRKLCIFFIQNFKKKTIYPTLFLLDAKILLDFEIEVVKLASNIMEQVRRHELKVGGPNTPDKPPISAVRRRRIKGDTFLYKNICNSILNEIDQSS